MDPAKSKEISITRGSFEIVDVNNYQTIQIYTPTNGVGPTSLVQIYNDDATIGDRLTGWEFNASGTQGDTVPSWNSDGSIFNQNATTFDVAGVRRVVITNNTGGGAGADQYFYTLSNSKLTYPAYQFLALAPPAGANQQIKPVSKTNPIPVDPSSAAPPFLYGSVALPNSGSVEINVAGYGAIMCYVVYGSGQILVAPDYLDNGGGSDNGAMTFWQRNGSDPAPGYAHNPPNVLQTSVNQAADCTAYQKLKFNCTSIGAGVTLYYMLTQDKITAPANVVDGSLSATGGFTPYSTTNPQQVQQVKNKVTFSAAGVATNTGVGFNWSMIGSATKTVKIRKIRMSGTNTVLANNPFNLRKASTAPTGGTPAVVTATPHDTNDAIAATAVVSTYSGAANGVLGTLVGNIRFDFLFLAPSTATIVGGQIEWTFGDEDGEYLTLNGAAQSLTLGSGIAYAGLNLYITVEWEEF